MTRIMFVCHGNICRSPMAEFIFKKIVSDAGAEDKFFVSSSATSTEEIWNGIGNPVYPPARAELAKHGVSCGGKRAVQLKRGDIDSYDYFICMDDNNVRNAARILGSDEKISKLLMWAGSSASVSDPWYSGDFTTAYRDIEDGCLALFNKLGGDSNGKH